MALTPATVFTDPLAASEPLAWLVVATFLLAAVLEGYDRERARGVAVIGWVLFGVFWLVLVPHFVFEQKSIVEGLGSIAAVPLSVYTGYRLWQGRDSLFVLTRAVAVMGLVYLPFLTIDPLRRWLIELVTEHTAVLMSLLDYEPQILDGLTYKGHPIPEKTHPDRSTFLFPGNVRPITYTIVIACTGIGSMSIFAGLIAAVDAPLRRKARALALSVAIIYALNLVRNVFIGVSFGYQKLQIQEDLVMSLFGSDSVQMVSYYIADRIVAQFASVVALVAITWLVVRELPEVLVIVEDALYLLTGSEYDLGEAIGVGSVDGDRAAD